MKTSMDEPALSATIQNPMPTAHRAAQSQRPAVDLSSYNGGGYSPGRGILVQTLWYLTSLLLFESGLLPSSRVKRGLLRLFGARVGAKAVIKPHVRIKFPWRLALGDHVWLGQEVWIDNLADVTIGSNVCLSQRVYLCTGSHDYGRPTFDLITRPIIIEEGSWVAASALVLPGVRIGAGAVVAAGSVVTKEIPPGTIAAGQPARIQPAPTEEGSH